MSTAPPAQFGGPGDHWSPETLRVGAVANCFILTFRSVARAAKLPWLSLRAEVTGTLDRVERTTQFTHFVLRASLQVPVGAWHDHWRQAGVREYLTISALTASTLAVRFLVPPAESPSWTGPVLFDSAVRDALPHQ